MLALRSKGLQQSNRARLSDEEHRQRLRSWNHGGFECLCSLCSLPAEQRAVSDARRAQIRKLKKMPGNEAAWKTGRLLREEGLPLNALHIQDPAVLMKLIQNKFLIRGLTLEGSCCLLCGGMGKLLRCSRCHDAHYCSREHQRKHWREHKCVCSETVISLPVSAATPASTSTVA